MNTTKEAEAAPGMETQDMPHNDGPRKPAYVLDMGRQFDELRDDLDDKHRQNREAIKSLQDGQQRFALRLAEMEHELASITGRDGRPGALDTLSDSVNGLRMAVDSLNLSRAVQAGAETEKNATTKRDRFLIGTAVTLIIGGVPFLVVLLQHIFGSR